MKKNTKPLVVGNWKTNPAHLEDAKRVFLNIRRAAQRHTDVAVVICPPFPYIYPLAILAKSSDIAIGGQDVSIFEEGSKTGEVSAEMVETSGAKFVIVGHSERRAMGDTDQIIATKVNQALKTGMSIILCVGEKDRDAEGEYLNVIKQQLKDALLSVPRQQFSQIVIAYEPVWAIGRQDNIAITSHDLHQMVIYIKKFLKESWGESIVSIIPILYGGSVTAENAQDILWNGEVDGLLVGRASWQADTFEALFSAVDSRQQAKIRQDRTRMFDRKNKVKVVEQKKPRAKSLKRLIKKVKKAQAIAKKIKPKKIEKSKVTSKKIVKKASKKGKKVTGKKRA